VLAILIGLTLSAPASVAACQCMGLDEGDVVFTGTVIDSPNELTLLHDIWVAQPGVYTFDVESVERGNAFDGRVHSSGATCESAYEVGATYRVHARNRPGDEGGSPTGVSLSMGPCMVTAQRVAAPAPLTALPYWALSFRGVLVLGAGLFFLMVGTAYLWYSRRELKNQRSVP
jgi:hypothetical protein